MSRQDAPSEGYIVECDRDGSTWILGGHNEKGFTTFVFTQATAEEIARKLTAEHDTQWHVVPAPGEQPEMKDAESDAPGFFFAFF